MELRDYVKLALKKAKETAAKDDVTEEDEEKWLDYMIEAIGNESDRILTEMEPATILKQVDPDEIWETLIDELGDDRAKTLLGDILHKSMMNMA